MIRLFTYLTILFLLITEPTIAQTNNVKGAITAEELKSEHKIFDIYTQRYQPDSTSVAFLSDFDHIIDIKILFGSWCHDSKREVSAFIKTIELANNTNFRIQYMPVNEEKMDSNGFYERYNLQYTPTFIILMDENEIGRIVESPTESIEQDLVSILSIGNFKDR
jgi:thiol-disulfide isomerase/thioredoxin